MNPGGKNAKNSNNIFLQQLEMYAAFMIVNLIYGILAIRYQKIYLQLLYAYRSTLWQSLLPDPSFGFFSYVSGTSKQVIRRRRSKLDSLFELWISFIFVSWLPCLCHQPSSIGTKPIRPRRSSGGSIRVLLCCQGHGLGVGVPSFIELLGRTAPKLVVAVDLSLCVYK